MDQNLDKGSVCQFYVVFGGNGLKYPVDGNVYIDADQFRTVEDLKKAVLDEFQKQSKNYKKVSSEIIFWIPAENYRESAEHIMMQVGFNGKIEVTPFKMVEKKEENVSNTVVQNNSVSPSVVKNVGGEQEEKIVSSETFARSSEVISSNIPVGTTQGSTNVNTQGVVEKNEATSSYHSAPVYRGDFEIPVNKESERELKNIQDQSAFSNGYGSMRYDDARGDFNQQRGKARVKKKPNAFVSLPVIIFVLSALLLISSAILLFVMD